MISSPLIEKFASDTQGHSVGHLGSPRLRLVWADGGIPAVTSFEDWRPCQLLSGYLHRFCSRMLQTDLYSKSMLTKHVYVSKHALELSERRIGEASSP